MCTLNSIKYGNFSLIKHINSNKHKSYVHILAIIFTLEQSVNENQL